MGAPLRLESSRTERGQVLELPQRPARGSRAWACAPLFFGLLFTALPVVFLVAAYATENTLLMRVFITLFVLPFLAIGVGGLVVALAIVSNRVTLRVERERLAVVERVGPLRWTKTYALDALGTVAVAGAPRKHARRPAGDDEPSFGLRFLRDGAAGVWVARGYPPDFLREVARELNAARGVQADVEVEPVSAPEPRAARMADDDLDDLAAPSDLHAHVEDGAWVLEVPPAGLVRGSRGLFAFAVFWNGFLVIFTGAFLGLADMGLRDGLMFGLFISVFWAVGIGVALASWNMGKRHAILRAGPGGLEVERRGPFGAKVLSFECAALKHVRVGHSGMSVNDVPVMELQITPRRGKRLGMLSQRPDDELEWIAAALNRRLELEAPPG